MQVKEIRDEHRLLLAKRDNEEFNIKAKHKKALDELKRELKAEQNAHMELKAKQDDEVAMLNRQIQLGKKDLDQAVRDKQTVLRQLTDLKKRQEESESRHKTDLMHRENQLRSQYEPQIELLKSQIVDLQRLNERTVQEREEMCNNLK